MWCTLSNQWPGKHSGYLKNVIVFFFLILHPLCTEVGSVIIIDKNKFTRPLQLASFFFFLTRATPYLQWPEKIPGHDFPRNQKQNKNNCFSNTNQITFRYTLEILEHALQRRPPRDSALFYSFFKRATRHGRENNNNNGVCTRARFVRLSERSP